MSKHTLIQLAALLLLVSTVVGTASAIAPSLNAGKTIPAGKVWVWDDGTNLIVKYETMYGWQLTETHLAVARNPDLLPQTKKGNPIPGQFAYKQEGLSTTVVKEIIPLDDIPGEGDIIYIAAHAVVSRNGESETAWMGCAGLEGYYTGVRTQFGGNNWGYYIKYPLSPE
ncbi:hypothetical protein ABH15_01785 [Methanoculleus taiwanensis]|uniref:Uncharacterized protein n=1 Tax=Methanoculleus taiwanensis TaxID=1550565 RepID=A0A498H595_9EURY|nr:hypothetical protein [Methanoculleus taiwanensis]RXE56904.1 hypothetical protein ABH15_01785 [Methanoculleus taiwanensis]